jgi:hypothetical protein
MVVLPHPSRLRSLSSLSRVDLYQPGVVLTAVCATTALLAMIFFVVTLVWPKNATGSLKIQAWIFTFFSVWLFATQIPYTIFIANRNAKIDAFLAGRQLPAQAVQAALAAAGESTKYSKLHFGTSTSYQVGYFMNHDANFSPSAVLLAIFPWISLLSSIVLVFVLFAAARRHKQSPVETTSQPPISDGEKGDHKHES